MDFIFLGAGAGNGYDALGHFLRAEVVATACLKYGVVVSAFGCTRKIFSKGTPSTPSSATKASTAGSEPQTLIMARTLAVLKGATPAAGNRQVPRSCSKREGTDGCQLRGCEQRGRELDADCAAGWRLDLGHHLLLARSGSLGRGWTAPQLPPGELSEP